MADETDTGLLFEDITFTIIPHESRDPSTEAALLNALQSSGAKYVPLDSDDQAIVDLESLSHIIAEDIEFPEYARAMELGIRVVTSNWVTTSIQRKRRTSERQYSPDPAQFFRDVIVTCAGLPAGDQEAIFAGVIALGGNYSYRLTKLVTHIVTIDIEHQMCQLAIRMAHPALIVLPHWFHDCFSLGKKIRERPYTLPDPEVLRPNIDKMNIKITPSPYLEGVTSPSPTKMPVEASLPSPSATRKTLNAFMSKKIFLCDDLQLSAEFIESIEKLISHGGGLLTTRLEDADIYIGQYRQGADYIAASQNKKEVANLSWLYHVINRNKYVSPLRKLFHYPLPPNGIKGFEVLKISLSNYAGDARAYIENLIRYCGAEYTKTMKQDNTHLITAHKHGEKYDAAQEWGVEVINHLWLEESFAKCSMQRMSNPRYTTFPARTNLGEVTGLTSHDIKCVEREYFAKPRSPQKKTLQTMSPKNVLASSKVSINPKSSRADAEDDLFTSGAEVEPLEMDSELSLREKDSHERSAGSFLRTPRLFCEQRNSPNLNSTGRASKLKALDTLHLQAPDIISFQKEMKRKGGVTHGGRRSSRDDQVSPLPHRTSRKRPSDEYDVTAEGSDLSDGETQHTAAKQNKKAKHTAPPGLPPIEYRMMVTGDDRWTDNVKKESADKITLRSLGILLTQDPKNVDILVAPKILRTRKFVSALACAPLVVDIAYLDHLLTKKRILNNPPLLQDPESEERLGFSLQEALVLASQNQQKLFRGRDIFVTKDVNGGFETYKDIIQLNGGLAMLYQGRSGLNAKKRDHAANDDDEDRVIYLVSGKTDSEKKLWKKFREEIQKQDLEARIVSHDWVLNAAMTQKISLDDNWILDS